METAGRSGKDEIFWVEGRLKDVLDGGEIEKIVRHDRRWGC